MPTLNDTIAIIFAAHDFMKADEGGEAGSDFYRAKDVLQKTIDRFYSILEKELSNVK